MSAETSVMDSTYQEQNRESLHELRAQKKHSACRWTWILVPGREEPPKQRGTWRACALWVDSGLGRDPSDARPSWNLPHTGPPTLWCADKSRCSEQQMVRTHLHQYQSEVLIQDDSKGFVTHKHKDSASNCLRYDRCQHLHPEHNLFSRTSNFFFFTLKIFIKSKFPNTEISISHSVWWIYCWLHVWGILIRLWTVAREFPFSLASIPTIWSTSLLSEVSGSKQTIDVCLTLMCYKSSRELPEDGLGTRRNASDL